MDINVVNVNYFNKLMSEMEEDLINEFLDLVEYLTEVNSDTFTLKETPISEESINKLIELKLLRLKDKGLYESEKQVWFVSEPEVDGIEFQLPSEIEVGDGFIEATGGFTEDEIKLLIAITITTKGKSFVVNNDFVSVMVKTVGISECDLYNSIAKFKDCRVLLTHSTNNILLTVNKEVCRVR